MRTIGIIAEYNPFHIGHAWQIRTAKKVTQADYCVVIMSPDYVQRGLPAIAGKYTRAAMALEGGADLVLELPVRYTLASAQGFARGGVGILNALGCVDDLVFGCETDSPGLLEYAAQILAREPAAYRDYLKEELRKGPGIAAAREKAMLLYCRQSAPTADQILKEGTDLSEKLPDALENGLLRRPNNILALEYLIALKWTGSTMTPLALQRQGAGYHENTSDTPIMSASGIRSMIQSNSSGLPAVLSRVIPEGSIQSLENALLSEGIPSAGRYSALLHYALIRMAAWPPVQTAVSGSGSAHQSQTTPHALPCSPALLSRILRALPHFTDAASFSSCLTTRQFPGSTVDRALLRIFLGLTEEECTPKDPAFPESYVRILGFRRSASPLMHALSADASIPVITKPASAHELLNAKQLAKFEADVNASHLYQLLFSSHTGELRSEYTHSPIICDL